MKVLATAWNNALKAAGALHAQAGPGVLIHRAKETTVSLAEDVGQWRHPWSVMLCWINGKWHFTVKAGFVNGFDPLVPGTAPPPTKENPKPQDLGLIDAGWIPVGATRQVGSDGSAVPAFFKKLGVKQVKTPDVTLANFDNFNLAELDTDPGTRSLVAFDIFVTVARATYSMTPTITNNIVLGSLVEYSVVYDTRSLDVFGARARLNQAPIMEEKLPLDLATRLSGAVGDDGLDKILIATCYLLSPEGQAGDTPDDNWWPYVQNKCFWNLAHKARNAMPVNIPQLGGVAGLFALTSRYTLAPAALHAAQEAEIQRIAEVLFNSTTNEGVFWNV